MKRELYRVRSNAMLGGVCAGLSEYLGLDVSLVRIFFVIIGLASGVGVLVYLVLWIVLPEKEKLSSSQPFSFQPGEFANRAREMGQEFGEAVRKPNPDSAKFIGIALVVAGILIFLQTLNLPWLFWLRQEFIWPVILILAGVLLVLRSVRGK